MTDEPKFWYVNQSFRWYLDHPTIMSRPKNTDSDHDRNWNSVKAGHKVIYNALVEPGSPEKGLVGLFEVTSGPHTDRFGKNLSSYYEIKPLYVPAGDDRPKQANIMKGLGLNRSMQGTFNKLSPSEYKKIKSFLLGMEEPSNHEGIVALFSKIHPYIGFPLIKRIGQSYPDVTVEDSEGNEKKIELEFGSDEFRKDMEKGKHDPDNCDIILCWEDNWGHARMETRAKRLGLKSLKTDYGS